MSRLPLALPVASMSRDQRSSSSTVTIPKAPTTVCVLEDQP